MTRRWSPLLGLALLTVSPAARAQYAPPPDAPREARSYPYRDDREPLIAEGPTRSRSTIRLLTGPALRLGDGVARAGLFAGADMGSAAAGLRLSGSWIGTGTDRGFSLYDAELWIDFGKDSDLHPILAAGAGVARVEHTRINGTRSSLEGSTLGVATLRATLQYRLPVDGVDARAGLDVSGDVRALGRSDVTSAAWAVAVATVGVGF